jgi:hypothetical protein
MMHVTFLFYIYFDELGSVEYQDLERGMAKNVQFQGAQSPTGPNPFPDCATQKRAFFAISAADAADLPAECVGKLARITNTRCASLLFSGQIGFAPRPKPDSPQALGAVRFER